MTEQEQLADANGAATDAATSTVSRDELSKAIHRRDSALERARSAEEKLAELETARVDRDRAEKQAQGQFQELAQEAEAKATAYEVELLATRQKLERFAAKHKEHVMARFESLPEDTRQHLADRLGEDPDLEALDNAVALAESLRPEAVAPSVPRNIGAQPSAGKVAGVNPGGKATAREIAKMSKQQMAAYLKQNYGKY